MRANNSEYNLAKVKHSVANNDIFLDGYPTMVHFLMIDKCNVKCIMCGGDYYGSTSGRKITLEKFKTMAANLKLENTRAVVLAGAGDPLLNRDLVPIVRLINSAYPHISISITTNGLALTEALSRSLLECTVSEVNVSINSASRKTYHRIMQVDGFDAVCKNARTFVELRRRMGKPVSFQFSVAINRLNIEEMPSLVELGKNIGSESINLFYTRFYPERIRHLNIDDPSQRLENDASLFFHQQLSDGMIEKAKSLAQRMGIRLTHEPLFKDHASSIACTWPMTQLMVGFDGEIYPCGGSEVHFKEKVENGIYNFGNVLKGPIDQFWNSETYRALRLSSRQGDSGCVPECKCCANVISPNDIRSHIMNWDMDEKTGITQKSISNPFENAVALNDASDSHQKKLMNARQRIDSLSDKGQAVPRSNKAVAITQQGKDQMANRHQRGDLTKPFANQIHYAFHHLVKSGHHDIAVWLLEKMLAEYPNHAMAHYDRAVLAFDAGDLKAAQCHYERAANLAPKNCEIQKGLAHFYHVALSNSEKALDQYQKVLSMNHNDAESLLIAGHLSVSQHQLHDAQHYYQHLLSIEPWHHDVRDCLEKIAQKRLSPISHVSAENLYQTGISKAKAGDNASALDDLQQAVEKDPNHALAHNDLGVLYYQAGKKQESLAHYEKAAELEPNNAILQKNLGDFYFIDQQNLKGALEKYVQALRLNPEDVETLLSTGLICMTMKKYEDARYFFSRVLELEPWNEDVSQLMIRLGQRIHEKAPLVQRSEHDKKAALKRAEEHILPEISRIEALVSMEPNNATALNDLGVLYYRIGDKEKALHYYEQAADLEPTQNTFNKNLADFYLLEQGRIEDAMRIYVKALENDPEDVESLIATGLVCMKIDEFDEARLFYQRALEIEPWNSNVRQALRQLDQTENEAARDHNSNNSIGIDDLGSKQVVR